MSPISLHMLQHAIENPDQSLSCMHFHKDINCNLKMIEQFIAGSKSISKMYLIVHLVPFLLFKRKKVKQNPKKEILKLLLAFAKSILFAGGYSALVRRSICFYTTAFQSEGLSCSFAAIMSAFTLNFEPIGRQSQIALFCLNKALQTTYNMMLRRKYPVRVPYGQGLLMAVSLAIITYHYFNNKKAIRDNYLGMIDKLLSNS